MSKAFPAVLAALVALAPGSPSIAAGASAASPAPNATAPPQIIHIVTRPLCSELHKHIAPAIGMMLENDQTIQKGPDLFSKYNVAGLYGTDNTASNDNGAHGGAPLPGDAGDATMNPSQNIALLGMENLVGPIANNIIAIKKMLDSPALTTGTGVAEDDKKLQEIRAKLLHAVETQSQSLDIINGFVATKQMGDLQHAGQDYINAINQSDNTHVTSTPSPNPLLQDPNQAGLPPDPYSLNLANIPGLTLGANPTTRLLQALNWTIGETKTRENDAANAVMNNAALCASGAPPSSPTP